MKCSCGNNLPIDLTGDTSGLCVKCQWKDIIAYYNVPKKVEVDMQDQVEIDKQELIDSDRTASDYWDEFPERNI